jgi:phenylacetate-coenzyme A ligase PaaK-like adenylate-forming protein
LTRSGFIFTDLCSVKLTFRDSEIFERAEKAFAKTALDVYAYQYANCETYRRFSDALKLNPENVKSVDDIPFLPVEFFKTQKIYCSKEEPEVIFTSSGTTGTQTSSHYVRNIHVYEESFLKGFERAYGKPEEFIFLFLLPSYLERDGSSLVYMAEELRRRSFDPDSGYYLNNYSELVAKLKSLQANPGNKKVLLLGVTYALLDLAELCPQNLSNITIMETGGMKGKRKEITRDELHSTLKNAFQISNVHSEYGMTELLSQAYSKGYGVFTCPPWMKIIIRETNDPLSLAPPEKTGGVNIIDLANLHSCSFISTSDLGKVYADGSFEILGRFDFSDTRGCNLLYV